MFVAGLWSQIWIPAESGFWNGVGVGRVLLLDCTLSLVLPCFDQCAVLAGCATSRVSCHAALVACTLLCTFYKKDSEFLSSHP